MKADILVQILNSFFYASLFGGGLEGANKLQSNEETTYN